jgi:hypothetical protein
MPYLVDASERDSIVVEKIIQKQVCVLRSHEFNPVEGERNDVRGQERYDDEFNGLGRTPESFEISQGRRNDDQGYQELWRNPE